LETDRGAVLTIRAAARGVIDFGKARLLDVDWWRRARLLVNSMAEDDALVWLNAAHDFHCALVGNGSLTKESFDSAKKGARETFNEVMNTVRPWDAKSVSQIEKEQIGSMVDLYKRLVGDPSDPAFYEKMLKDVEAQEALAAEAASRPDPEQELNRQLAERDRRREGKKRR
jgi:hypothetical protein